MRVRARVRVRYSPHKRKKRLFTFQIFFSKFVLYRSTFNRITIQKYYIEVHNNIRLFGLGWALFFLFGFGPKLFGWLTEAQPQLRPFLHQFRSVWPRQQLKVSALTPSIQQYNGCSRELQNLPTNFITIVRFHFLRLFKTFVRLFFPSPSNQDFGHVG